MQLRVYKWRTAYRVDDTYDLLNRYALHNDQDLCWHTWSIKITYEN